MTIQGNLPSPLEGEGSGERGTTLLIVGSGSREHALAWKLTQSPVVDRIYVAPGNAGTSAIAENVPVAATDLDGIVRLAGERDIDLTVVGPEAPLALGLADRLRAAGRAVAGPDMGAARIESSKSFAKSLMTRAGVPTAAYRVFDRPEEAIRYLARAEYPVVIKADGLAAGKGVTICAGPTEALKAVGAMMIEGIFGDAGRRVVIEEALRGPEISLLALVNGDQVVPLPVAQDHKRLGDGDTGPNTGGMGAYAPVPFVDAEERDRLVRTILEPAVAELARCGTPYRGVLFAGLMLTDEGPRVLEFNCRFGDPEAQVILPPLEGDLLPWLQWTACRGGSLYPPSPHIASKPQSAVGVVLAAKGYPEKPESGVAIEGLNGVPDDVLVFHAGTATDKAGRTVTAGGRVLTVVGLGASVDEAVERAYSSEISFEGMQLRKDIGWQGRSRAQQTTDSRELQLAPAAKHDLAGPAKAGGYRSLAAGGEGAHDRIAILASGEGSNLQALLDASARGDLDARVVAVISHRKGAGALARARAAGVAAIEMLIDSRKDLEARRAHEEQLLDVLLPLELDLAVLAGWMLILSAEFLARCPFPILNVHPALLPMEGDALEIPVLKGAHAVRDALALGLPYTGVSVHRVTPQVDGGPVVVREAVPIEPGDDEESLYRRIKAVEHRLLPMAVQAVLARRAEQPAAIHVGGVYA